MTDDNPDKFAIAQILRDIGNLLRLRGENKFRANAYDAASQAVEGLSEDLGTLIKEKRLTTVKGIGSSIASVVTEIYETGGSSTFAQLQTEFPPGAAAFAALPGLSLKKIESLHRELRVTSVSELKEACEQGRLKAIKGFGEKAEKAILEAIVALETGAREVRLVDVLHLGSLLLDHMRSSNAVLQADFVGSISRWDEAVSSLDVVACGPDRERICELFWQFPYLLKSDDVLNSAPKAVLKSVLKSDGSDASPISSARDVQSASERELVLTTSACLSENRLPVNLYVCAPAEFTCLRHFLTGTDSYNKRLVEIAKSNGVALGPRQLSANGETVAIGSESELYASLSLPYVPVELRDDPANLDDALEGADYADLIEIGDIRGMTHCHSTFSDGVASIDQMVRAVKAMKMQYITITDHSPTAHYANGVAPDRLRQQWREIEEAQAAHGIRVFRGTESDILADGQLDYEDAVLSQLDVIIASIHARMKMDEEQMTQRLVNCMLQKQFKIWGHALGRLVLKRAPIACRMEEVIEIASKSRVAIEVNGDPHRLDMQPKWLKLARRKKMKFVISTDAHSISDLQNLKFGIHLARKAGMRKGEVLNTLSHEAFAEAVKP